MTQLNYITEDKKRGLEVELKDLKGPKRQEILDSLKYAKSLGDLSENAEYHQARDNQAHLEDRILKIEHLLQTSCIATKELGDKVRICSTVVVKRIEKGDIFTGEEKTFMIVGNEEADTLSGKISVLSPFGQAIFGKKKGDNFSFQTPNGIINYKIISLS
ncbi:MAG: transcription elongation factor GreA [Patescibacteria group bacterium]